MISLASDRTASLPSMRWPDFRKMHPDAWIIVEVIASDDARASDSSHATSRRLEAITVLEVCRDAETTHRRYRELRRADPHRELCFLHTAWEAELEERWQFSRELRDTLVTV